MLRMPMTPAMDPLLLEANSGIIGIRLRSMLAAEKRLAVEVSVVGSGFDERSMNHENLWDAIFSILDYAAVLSRMFWQPWVRQDTPAKRAAKERNAEQVRLWLDIADDSVFNKDGRDARNTIEHSR